MFTESFVAELPRAKRASETPWVMKIGNPSSRENLVMMSAYERPSERVNAVRTDSGGGGGASQGKPHKGSKPHGGIRQKKKNSFRYSLCQRTFRDVELTFKVEFI